MNADRDASVRASILTGAGPAFCARLDRKQVQRDGSAHSERFHAENCITKVAQRRKGASKEAAFVETHSCAGIVLGAAMT